MMVVLSWMLRGGGIKWRELAVVGDSVSVKLDVKGGIAGVSGRCQWSELVVLNEGNLKGVGGAKIGVSGKCQWSELVVLNEGNLWC